MSALIIGLYVSALAFILLYSVVQLNLAFRYLRYRRTHSDESAVPPLHAEDTEDKFPFVTVQLPLYNEMYVAERLIDAVCAFQYPSSRFEVQVLDDSTDETVELVAAKVKEYSAKGIRITQVRRTDRKGFKAGALEEGLLTAHGEFIAIFDADFIPRPDFLLRTIPWFADPGIGVVQTRWEHLNENYNLLTKMQAFALDAHFSVEQLGRNSGGYFINFNGTAGVWRKNTITDAGGWQPDTLTEDLDLSYRAQLKGWKFKFLEHVGSPSELPAAMPALKSQQFRWTKGAAEVARKNLGSVLRAKLSFGVKLNAFFHLLNSFLFVCILTTACLSVPMVWLKVTHENLDPVFKIAMIFMASMFCVMAFYWVSRTYREPDKGFKRVLKFVATFPIFLSISMGLSLHNAIATIEGYLGIKSPFIRTPKFNLRNLKDSWENKKNYAAAKISLVTILEGVFTLYFLAGIVYSVYWREYSMLPFLIMLCCGFFGIFWYSVRHTLVSS